MYFSNKAIVNHIIGHLQDKILECSTYVCLKEIKLGNRTFKSFNTFVNSII